MRSDERVARHKLGLDTQVESLGYQLLVRGEIALSLKRRTVANGQLLATEKMLVQYLIDALDEPHAAPVNTRGQLRQLLVPRAESLAGLFERPLAVARLLQKRILLPHHAVVVRKYLHERRMQRD